ncbi:Oxygen sensor protein DosP [compost metagenome]
MLTLEILENAEVALDPATSLLLRQFKELGVCLAEDDLGAGHSSLRRLRELPFDWIKIDRHIVRLLDTDNWEVLHFIYQLTRLGHSLCKAVVVEGVETADLVEAVRILGVDAAQGYGIARPMAGAQLAEWIGSDVACPRGQPATALGRLARLLIVEERLHLTQADHDRRDLACESVCDVAPALAGSARSAAASCLSCQLHRFRVDLDRIFPGDASCRVEKDALLHAASRHGLASHHYRQARRRLATRA